MGTSQDDCELQAAQEAMGWTKQDEPILGPHHVVVQAWRKSHPRVPLVPVVELPARRIRVPAPPWSTTLRLPSVVPPSPGAPL